jgi:ferredoxin
VRLTVEWDRCTGHGRCYTLVPELFDADDLGYCSERGKSFEIPSGLDARAMAAVDGCPEMAIRVDDLPRQQPQK